MKKAILLSTIMFISPFIFGYIVGDYSPTLKSKNDLIHSEPGWNLFVSVFTNNLLICIVLILGIFIFSIPTIYLLVVNGFVLGIGVSNLIAIEYSTIDFIKTLLPHVLLEIPAFILAGAIGLKGLTFYIIKENRLSIKSFSIYSIILLIALLIAAILEAYISAKF
ncbi:stage II sporulation protein M [Mammaliicoccus sciuri]|uniref:stage II sporulation protein M n=1 Tax=Mammaliicoccus sciuri TaxID=1296 RepID=UPI000D1DC1CC|nr:stage II sporulation protein M [Mammaliicoccus sciuri]MCE5041963.1 stage II sporulation protein M [Mammaliicoccus sciuri]PTJ62206.1 hypothetical protein BUZ97_12175 [Mammaliicoccus sciuri]